MAQGLAGLVASWVETIRASLTDEEGSPRRFDPSGHKLLTRLVPDYLEELAAAEAQDSALQAEKESFERGEGFEGDFDFDEPEEGEEPNAVKQLEDQRRQLKASIAEERRQIKALQKQNATRDSLAEIAALQARVAPVQQQIEEIDRALAPYEDLKKKLTQSRRKLRELAAALMERVDAARASLTQDQTARLVLDIAREDLQAQLERYVTAHRQQIIAAVENWWDKYQCSMLELEQRRLAPVEQTDGWLRELGYAR